MQLLSASHKLCLVTIIVALSACSSIPKVPFTGKKADSDPAAQTITSLTGLQSSEETNNAAIDNSLDGAQSNTEPRFLPGDLLGLSAPQLDDLLGAASFVTRSEGASQLRRYDRASCNIIVIMSRDASGRILSNDMKASKTFSSSPTPTLQECLRAF